MRHRHWQIPVLLVTLLLCPCFVRKGIAQVTPPKENEAWVLQLIHHTVTSYTDNIKLVKDHPDESYEIVKNHWGEILSFGSKQSLLATFRFASSTHLLDLLDIAINDDNSGIRFAAQDQLVGFTFQLYSDADINEYKNWKQSVKGLSQERVVQRETLKFFHRVSEMKDTTERTAALNLFLRVDIESDLPLARVRKEATAACGGLSVLSRFLKPESVTVTDLQAVRALEPDKAYQDKYIVPLTGKEISGPIRYAAITLLTAFKNPVATAILMQMLTEPAAPESGWVLWQALSSCTDVKMLPVLIGVMEAEDDPQVEEAMFYTMLRLAQSGPDQARDAGYWRMWYRRNQKNIPELNGITIPHLQRHLRRAPVSPVHRRRLLWRDFAGEDAGYWLVSPGYVEGGSAAEPHTQFGLLTVVCTADVFDNTAEYWQKAQKLALTDGYFVAVVAAPTDAKPAIRAQKLQAQLNRVVEDTLRSVPIDKSRVYLQGVGDAGQSVIAVSAAPSTPFKGFWTIASPFKSQELPPLTSVKGRRYLLQGSPTDKLAPMWQVNAGATILKKQGAIVQVTEVAGDGFYNYTGDAYKPITAGMQFLELRPHL